MRCIFNRLSRAQRPCCWKPRLLKMRLFFFKLHSLVHKLKAIDFALHTSHIENLLWNVLECQENHARNGAQSVLKYLGGLNKNWAIYSKTVRTLRFTSPSQPFSSLSQVFTPPPPSVTPIAFFFLSELAIMIDVQSEELEKHNPDPDMVIG